MILQRTDTPDPNVHAVTWAQVRDHLRYDEECTPMMLDLVGAAEQHAESYTGRQLLTATYDLKLPRLGRMLALPKPPLVQVDSITYLDGGQAEQTLDPSAYRVHTVEGDRGLLYIDSTQALPAVYPREDAVTISLTAGYGADATHVPPMIRLAIVMFVAEAFRQREDSSPVGLSPVPLGINRLLDRYRLMEVR